MNPEISVLMPIYNSEAHLHEAIDSVLAQTFSDFELLIVNDASPDGSARVARAFSDPRIRIFTNDVNLGLVATLNRGLNEARGKFIARLDGDDVAKPKRFATQLAFLRGNPSVPVLGSDARLIDERGRWRGRWRTAGSADLVRWDCGFRTPFPHSSVMFRRDLIVNRFGGYQDMRASEDLDLWSRVAAELPVVSLTQELISYRQHPTSIMAQERAGDDMPRRKTVRELLLRNLGFLAPGGGDDFAILANVWSGVEESVSWPEYFDALLTLRLSFLRGHRRVPGFARVCADQHYMIFCRLPAADRVPFLRTWLRCDRSGLSCFPWLRAAVMLLRG